MNRRADPGPSVSDADGASVREIGAPDHPWLDSPGAWLSVAAAFLSTFTVFGVFYSFASFFPSMAAEFGTGKAATSLFFSATAALYFALGPITGRVVDRVGPRALLLTAAATLGVGLVATSRVDAIWLGYITYGLGVGVAIACAFVPMIAAVGASFERRRPAALGVSVAGIGLGTLVVVPLAERLIHGYGWRTAYVVLGSGGATVLLVAGILVRRPPVPTSATPADFRWILRSRGFAVLYANALLVALPLFVPFVFLKAYAEDHGVNSARAAGLVGILGATSLVGRVLLGALGARMNVIALLRLTIAAMTGSFTLWLFAGSNYQLLVLYAAVMGASYGGFNALSPAVVAVLFGTRALGQTLGTIYTAVGVGALIGPPLAGEVIDRASYSAAILLTMALGAASAIVLLALPATNRPSAGCGH